MNCNEVKKLLSAYIDNELSGGESREVETHLAACTSCRHELATLKAAVSLVQGLDELDVPTDVRRALRTIEDEQGGQRVGRAEHHAARRHQKRGSILPPLRYLVGVGAVAAIALVVLLSQLTNTPNAPVATQSLKDTTTYGSRQLQPESAQKHDINSVNATKDQENATVGGSAATLSAKSSEESVQSNAKQASPSGSQDATAVQPPFTSKQTAMAKQLPIVKATKNNYSDASASKLLIDIQKQTEGIYTVKDARTKRAAMVNAMLNEISRQGGEGTLVRAPINALLDQTKRDALPVYIEKAQYKNKNCLVIIIRWGFGNEQTSLYKASVYITDLSGWDILRYESR
ncbi:MAG TPA: zf-HC2 domain-containing protein [Candidatus Aquicultor sp.]|jgi:hypothetical protein